VLTIRPVQQKYHLYKGKTDAQSISDYLTKVVENQIEVLTLDFSFLFFTR
jgi:hypothetical protein